MKRLGIAFAVLDIETSSFSQLIDGKEIPTAVWLSYGWCKLYSIKGNCIDKCYFRDWKTLSNFFYYLQNKYVDYEIRCYVHNLAYEFDFLIKNLSKAVKIISNSTHNVISAKLENYMNILFVCSYQLSGYSLEKIGQMVGLPKLESDYRCILPDDEITQEEIDYCERDCDIVAKYIVDVVLKEFDLLRKIPLTKTGRVRKTLKEFYSKLEYNPNWDLMPNEDCYGAMCNAFAGGITTSNPNYTDCVIENVHSYDITSSYPFAILKEEYPYSIEKLPVFDNSFTSRKFWIAKIRFNKIRSLYSWAWLSISKMNDYAKDGAWFNGKCISCDYIVRTVTNVDFESINMTYEYDSYEILEFYDCQTYGEIPAPYIETVKLYSKKKYDLKNILEKMDELDEKYQETEREYMLSKNDFNSIYGMCVQKLVQEEFEIDENYEWRVITKPYKKKEGKHIGRNFLFGIYITAYARRNLLTAIVVNCPNTFVYCDTDSVKFIGENKFIDTNKRLQEKYLSIPSLSKLGTFCYEKTYEKFKTLGAKKYCYTHGDRVFLTVAGLPKSRNKDEDYLQSIDDFKCGVEFKNCKLAKRYVTSEYSYYIDDNLKSKDHISTAELNHYLKENGIDTKGGVALFPVSYKLDMTPMDKWYVDEIKRYRNGECIWQKRK